MGLLLVIVKLANPASWVTLDSIEDAREAPGITPWAFSRFRANRWTTGFESWLPERAWDALVDLELEPPDGAGVIAGLDFARFEGESPAFTVEAVDRACRAYFV